jgi:SPP1 family predicted phage head-tail adaptor
MPLNAGQLDRRITIQQRAAGVDARGQPNGAWTDVATVWAMPMPRAGREYFAAGQLQAEGGMAWRIRNRSGITAAMRIVEGAEAWEISAPPMPSPNREWLDLYCLQGVRDGR